MADLCGVCAGLVRGPKNRERELRGRDCPRFDPGRVHVGCCALQECSRVDGRSKVRCDFARWSKANRAAGRALGGDAAERAGAGGGVTCTRT